MLNKTRSVVLHHTKYTGSNIIVHSYTELYGRQSFIVSGIKNKKSHFHFSLFQPLSVLDLEIYYKLNRDIQRIKEVSVHKHYNTIHTNIHKGTIALFISEVLYKTLHEEEPNVNLFDFLIRSIHTLDTIQEGISNFHLIFLLEYSRFLGIYPENIFNDDDQYSGLRELLNHSFSDLHMIKISNDVRIKLLQQLTGYYSHYLEGMGNIKSLEILKQVYQ